MKKKRDLFTELTEGFDAFAEQRTGKRTLRTHTVKVKPAPKIIPRELAKVRKDMNLSRGLFAGYLRTNVRTLENLEQGRARPNAQAALLIRPNPSVTTVVTPAASASVGNRFERLLRSLHEPGQRDQAEHQQCRGGIEVVGGEHDGLAIDESRKQRS